MVRSSFTFRCAGNVTCGNPGDEIPLRKAWRRRGARRRIGVKRLRDAGGLPDCALCRRTESGDRHGLAHLRQSRLRVCTHDELSDYIRSAPRFIGSAKCRKALRLSKPGTDSPQETVLRLESDAYGLPEAHVNYEIIDHIRGSGTMKVDIAYPDDRVCIEYDGNYHYTHGRWMYDLDKRNRLRDLGFTPFVATREHLASKQKLNELFGMVARAIASHRYGLD